MVLGKNLASLCEGFLILKRKKKGSSLKGNFAFDKKQRLQNLLHNASTFKLTFFGDKIQLI
jgi:hypothetical protein